MGKNPFAGFGASVNEARNADIAEYTKYADNYYKILQAHLSEIQDINNLIKANREEQKCFYEKELPEIQKKLIAEGIDESTVKFCVEKIATSMARSFSASEELLDGYVTTNIEDFKQKLRARLKNL